jgi:hypothetical protein
MMRLLARLLKIFGLALERVDLYSIEGEGFKVVGSRYRVRGRKRRGGPMSPSKPQDTQVPSESVEDTLP